MTCPRCNGTGTVKFDRGHFEPVSCRCSFCLGTGQVKEPKNG